MASWIRAYGRLTEQNSVVDAVLVMDKLQHNLATLATYAECHMLIKVRSVYICISLFYLITETYSNYSHVSIVRLDINFLILHLLSFHHNAHIPNEDLRF